MKQIIRDPLDVLGVLIIALLGLVCALILSTGIVAIIGFIREVLQ